MRLLPAGALAAFMLMAALVTGCRDEATPTVSVVIDPETTPTMSTISVNTVISDSGILRYRIISPEWYVYDEAREPYWRFPTGLHLEKYDDAGQVDATIDADSARYNMRRDLWQLDGYVCITNTDSTLFLTEQLFWDKLNRKVYTDSFIHIEQPDRVIEGYGFESNDRMTEYRVLRTSGIFPADRFKRDSTAAATPGSDDLFNPYAAATEDPEAAQRTDTAFNGVPTDTVVMRTRHTPIPIRRRDRRSLPQPMNTPAQ